MKIFLSYGRLDAVRVAQDCARHLVQMGHEPWLDVENGIPFGAPFDIKIEIAISECHVLIALLSESSIRPDGFCRNELLFAQAKNKPIVPIRLHKVIPPIQIISLNYLDVADDQIIPYDQLATILEEIAAHGQCQIDPLKAKASWWGDLRRLNYSEELARHGATFVGRAWLFADIGDWIAQPHSRLLLITADPGTGKSALSAQLTTRLNVRSIHFCSRSNIETCLPRSWLSEVIYQLARQFAQYRMELEQLNSPNWNDPPESLFRSLIIEPLRSCESLLNITEPWVFVIDSLDESLAEVGPVLIDLLTESAERMPAWLRIIMTSRPDQTIIAKCSIRGAFHYHINADRAENQRDISDYIEKCLGTQIGEEESDRLKNRYSIIKDISNGNFLYARLLLSALTDKSSYGSIDLENVKSVPAQLGGLYDRMFRNRFKDQQIYQQEIAPLLDCLAAAQEPLTEALLLKASKLPEHTAKKGLLALSQFLSRGKTCQLFHQSVIDWLKDANLSTGFAASVKDGHRYLSEACWAEYASESQNISNYTRSHLATHLANNASWDQLILLTRDQQFDLFSRWIAGGEAKTGLLCLIGAIGHLNKQKRNLTLAAGLATQLARIYSKLGRYEEAEQWLTFARHKTSVLKGRRLHAIALHELGSLALYRQDYQLSKHLYRKAYYICLLGIPRYLDEAAANLLGLATIYHSRYSFKKSIRLVNKALKKAKRAGDLHHYVSGERLLGTAYKSLGQFEKSREHLQAGLALTELDEQSSEKINLLALLGWLEYELATLQGKVPEKSRPYFEQALTIARKVHNYFSYLESQIALAWCDLAEMNCVNLASSLLAMQKELPKEQHFELYINTELALAACLQQNGELEKAGEKYGSTIQSAETHGFRFLYAKAHLGLGAVYWHSDRKAEAEKLWEIALGASHRISKSAAARIQAGIDLCKGNPRATPR